MISDMQLYYSNSVDSEYLKNSTLLFLTEVYDVMKECYGPYGSHIIIDNEFRPEATKDGKAILSMLKTNQTISSSIHKAIINVANKQVEEVGDGSTTTILLLCKLYKSFSNIIEKYSLSPSMFNETLKYVVSYLLKELKEKSEKIVYKKIDDDNNEEYIIDYDKLYNAIHTSADGNKELAEKILEMFKELNTIDPLILIENSPTENHFYELVKGVETNGTAIRPEIFFNGLSRMDYEDPSVAVINGRMDIKPDMFVELTHSMMRENKNIIFLATGISQDTLEAIVSINSVSPGMFTRVPIIQIRETASNEEFMDLCVSLGAIPIDSESLTRVTSIDALNNLLNKSCGHCSKALLTEFCARFNNPSVNQENVNNRIIEINEKIEDLKNDPTSHNNRLIDLENRKAFLSRHYAKFYVGGYSPQRKTINYELANDAIPQAISCMKHGIVNGCNTIIPLIINDKLNESKTDSTHLMRDYEYDTFIAIKEAYQDLKFQLLLNKNPLTSKDNIISNDAINIRENDNTPVINSADTDRAILENSTDMAALLATSKGFLSRSTEFDVVNKGYQKCLKEKNNNNFDEEAKLVESIQNIYGMAVSLRDNPNTGFTLDDIIGELGYILKN